jgi:hypothetical protein
MYSHKFDYIHGRGLALCFKNHLPVIQSAFRFARPGGYFELQDGVWPFRCVDDTMTGTALERWINLVTAAASALGKDWTRVRQYKAYMEESGFEDVVEKRVVWPIGTWARGKRMKMLGMWCKEDLLAGLQAMSMAVMTRGLGMTPEEVELLLVDVRKDINSQRIHAYVSM